MIEQLQNATLVVLILSVQGCADSNSTIGIDAGDDGGTRLDAGEVLDGGIALPDASKPLPVTSAELFPMAVGAKWTFDVTMSEFPSGCSDGTRVSEIMESEVIDGRETFHYRTYCTNGLRGYAYGPDGVDLWSGNDMQWYPFLRDTVEEGASWDATASVSIEWRYEGTVEVPAGTFSNCWTSVFSDEREYTLCPDVGITIVTGAAIGHRAELIAYQPGG